ncbi:hypothetical protein P4H94_02345 [Paenibacillus macerans]|uniref:hypothetical protein n=1 Tax=Paenibacillus macerans TaxID=44252 RepID=UPI0005652BEE|nr:hypothetical protein [Paenibacillus macerans]MBS5911463.1 hypothetical protein [Paenibacillus macerans]MCY7561337.1 hypothetical protein [Paenibacillus macerans]MDU5948286.1 hypothetical protein [Paenibacillus macerans]MEC0135741.1 hypothetical protein [Paenibacillus macerans]MEC0149300.1 hypothetical protein [Paenibacillus macerans]
MNNRFADITVIYGAIIVVLPLAQKIEELLVPIWEPDLEKASLSPQLPIIAVKNSFILVVPLTFGDNSALFFRFSTALGSLVQLWPPQLNRVRSTPLLKKQAGKWAFFSHAGLPLYDCNHWLWSKKWIGCCPYFIFRHLKHQLLAPCSTFHVSLYMLHADYPLPYVS